MAVDEFQGKLSVEYICIKNTNHDGPCHIHRKMGEEDSSRLRNLGAPSGGSNLGGALEVLIHLTQEEIKGTIIFLA